MKTILAAVAALMVLPVAAPRAQNLQFPAFYGGIEGGANWMRETNANVPGVTSGQLYPDLGWAAGGVIGYDFVGPRVELEGVFRRNTAKVDASSSGIVFGVAQEQISAMANVYYDFLAGNVIVPYVGVGAGADFIRLYSGAGSSQSTQFAYQGIVGVGWNVNEMFRLNLDGRYHASLNPTANTPIGAATYNNAHWTIMASAHIRFVTPPPAPVAAPPPAAQPAPSSYMVFFDFDRSDITPQAAATLTQVANTYKTKGSARVTATGHTDRAGPESYNMALSLRRANSVKDALVRNGVPATAIVVTGRGESMPLVPTADGVREAQNRRVEVVIQ